MTENPGLRMIHTGLLFYSNRTFMLPPITDIDRVKTMIQSLLDRAKIRWQMQVEKNVLIYQRVSSGVEIARIESTYVNDTSSLSLTISLLNTISSDNFVEDEPWRLREQLRAYKRGAFVAYQTIGHVSGEGWDSDSPQYLTATPALSKAKALSNFEIEWADFYDTNREKGDERPYNFDPYSKVDDRSAYHPCSPSFIATFEYEIEPEGEE